jgi:predicted nucleic acid-binding protein
VRAIQARNPAAIVTQASCPLFVALAEELGEPLVTKDAALADAATTYTGGAAILLADSR